MDDKPKNRILKMTVGVIVIIILAFGVWNAAPKLSQYRSLKEREAERDAEIREIERETREIMELERRFETDVECIQAVARENRRYHPDEIVFVFEEEKKDKKR